MHMVQQLQQAFHWRYACKKFDPTRKVPADVWSLLEDALVLSPSAYGIQPWKFLVVTDPVVKTRLRAASWNQAQVEDCSHLVVICGRKTLSAQDVEHYLRRVGEVRKLPLEALAGFRAMMLKNLVPEGGRADIGHWCARQAYIPLGSLVATAAFLGVDACPMEGLDPDRYDDILGLSGGPFHTLAQCAVGYRLPEDPYLALPKVRFPKEDVIQRI